MSDSHNSYRILIEPVGGRVAATRDSHVLASSTRTLVMHETRLEPCLYFPAADVDLARLEPTETRTFCPLKGTAYYFDLILDNERIENAAWQYQRALPDAKGIENHIAFMPDIVDRFDASEGLPEQTDDGHIGGALADWLMRDAALCTDAEQLTRQLAERIQANGIPLWRLSILIWALHPEIAGKNFVWRSSEEKLAVYRASHSVTQSPAYVNSPLRLVSEGLGGVRQYLCDEMIGDGTNTEFTFPIMEELKAEGATDYVAMPLIFSNGQINVMTLTSNAPNGFSIADLGLIFECSNMISRHYEVHALKHNTSNLLDTYLGRRTGARVLDGGIKRGDGETIEAAILFCDLRRSSLLAEQLPNGAFLTILNRFFDCVAECVEAEGGEILKFIGDAVLAIFPVDICKVDPCRRAHRVASAIVDHIGDIDLENDTDAQTIDKLACAIGLDFGMVTYGNIGAVNRLDFTVTGRAAIVASRLADLAKTQDTPILATRDIADACDGTFETIGTHQLRNISEPVELLTPTAKVEGSFLAGPERAVASQ